MEEEAGLGKAMALGISLSLIFGVALGSIALGLVFGPVVGIIIHKAPRGDAEDEEEG